MPYVIAINVAKKLNININHLHSLSNEMMDDD